ncbi:MAG TPA: DUF3822 family protein, partial [Bacteroidales bacterium]|nr:DUF3822 family protein [Bacteroidales bacterium]
MSVDSTLSSHWFDPEFDQENLPDYDLSVLAFRDSLTFVLTRLGQVSGIIRLADLPRKAQHIDIATLRSRIEQSGLPQGTVHQLDLYYRDERYSLLPEVLAREAEPRDFLNLRFSLGAAEPAEKQVKDELACFFVGRESLATLLQERCRKFSQRSYGMLVAQEAMRLSAGRQEILLADLGSRNLDAAIACGGELRYSNAFPVRTAEDAAFHLLNLYRQQPNPPMVMLTGDFGEGTRSLSFIA